MGESEAEHPADRIEDEARIGLLRGAGDRQVAQRAADDEIGRPGFEPGHRHRRALAAQQERRAAIDWRILLVLLGGFARREKDRPVALGRQIIGSRALAAAKDRHVRLGENLEEIGARRLEPDLEHLGDHRLDVVDRSKDRLERIAARRSARRASIGATTWSEVIGRPSGQVRRARRKV